MVDESVDLNFERRFFDCFVSFGSLENVSVFVFKLECVKIGFVVVFIGFLKYDKYLNSLEYFKVEEECFVVLVD